ncbi:MAG: hypothetical protein FWC66_03025 [Oscillospiraceae bacterium]|nr:hypothetical protein [Oscillospiraceae bacterium]
MTRTVKNIVMVFTLIAAIFLVIFCVELIIVNRETTENGSEPTVSADTPDENGEDGMSEENGYFDSLEDWYLNGFGEEDGEFGEIIIPAPRGETRFEMPTLLDDLTLIAYADEGFFNFFEGEYNWLFAYASEGEASLQISFDLITHEGIRALAGRVLLRHLDDGGQSRVLGERNVGASDIRGYAVISEAEDRTIEAWVHSLTGSPTEAIAVVFLITYENEDQREALFEILDTLEIISDDDEAVDDESDDE